VMLLGAGLARVERSHFRHTAHPLAVVSSAPPMRSLVIGPASCGRFHASRRAARSECARARGEYRRLRERPRRTAWLGRYPGSRCMTTWTHQER
jgi:hypothetical protein